MVVAALIESERLKMLPPTTSSFCIQDASQLSLMSDRKRCFMSTMGDLPNTNDNYTIITQIHSKKLRHCSEENNGEKNSRACSATSQTRSVVFNLNATTIHCLKRPRYQSMNKNIMTDVNSIFDKDSDSDSLLSEGSAEADVDAERNAMWYTTRELKQMKYDAKCFTKAIDICDELSKAYTICRESHDVGTNISYPTTSYSLKILASQRGLERWTSPMHCMERAIQVTASKTDVFIEQSNQMTRKDPDCAKLAQLYQNSTLVSVRFAQMLGSIDCEIANESEIRIPVNYYEHI
jgi:hypothetical protein